MKISVVRADNRVIIDGVGADVDCSDLSTHIHAIHWDGDAGRGEIEFSPDANGARMGNLEIASFNRFSFLHERWSLAIIEAELKKKTEKLSVAEKQLASAQAMQAQLAEFERVAAENAQAAEARAAEEAELRGKVSDLEERNRALEERLAALEQQTKAIQS
jgi:hypothetical protein